MSAPRCRSRRSSATEAHPAPRSDHWRTLVAFDCATSLAVDQLARDSMKSVQEVADEAFVDLLRKHNRPTDLKDALRRGAGLTPANDRNPGEARPGAHIERSEEFRRVLGCRASA